MEFSSKNLNFEKPVSTTVNLVSSQNLKGLYMSGDINKFNFFL